MCIFGMFKDTCSTMWIKYSANLTLKLQAVVLFHLHQFSAALSVLEPLYQNIEPIDEVGTLYPIAEQFVKTGFRWLINWHVEFLYIILQPAALYICILMLDIALASCQLRKACVCTFFIQSWFFILVVCIHRVLLTCVRLDCLWLFGLFCQNILMKWMYVFVVCVPKISMWEH